MMWKDWITLTPEQRREAFETYKKAVQARPLNDQRNKVS